MGIITTSVNSLNILNHILLVATVSLYIWQHHDYKTAKTDVQLKVDEGKKLTCTHQGLLKVCSEATVDVSTV
jgi:hypothetical protein